MYYWFYVLVLEGDKFFIEVFFEVKIVNYLFEEENLNRGKFSFGDFKEI